MKKLLPLCIAVASLVASNADAALLSYDFILTLNYVEETDGVTGVSRQLAQSNFSGTKFALGDTLRGKLTYDTNTLVSTRFWSCCGEVAYSDDFSKNELSFVNKNSGAVYTSGMTFPPTLIMSNYATTGTRREGSMLALTYAYSASVGEIGALTIVDRSGKTLGTTVPLALTFPDREAWFSYTWVRLSDNSLMRTGGIVSSLTESPAEVPEPATLSLLAAGFALLVSRSARTR
jgi:hypothetical protein